MNSLAALRDEKAVPALIPLTRNSDHEIAKAALLALGRISNDEALAIVREALISGLQVLRADAAAACLLAAENQLSQGNTDVAQALYDAVRAAQVPASYRIGATRGAILSRKSDRVDFLIEQLRSKEPAIRDVALLTIREIPSDALAAALNAELEDAQRDLQTKLMIALKDCHNAESLAIIKTKAKSDDPAICLTALRVLAAIGGPDDASAFLDVIKDRPGAEELSIATKSLEQMEGAEVNELIMGALRSTNESQARVQLIRLLGRRNVTGAADELLGQAAGSDRDVRIAAFQVLRDLAGSDELPRLIALTKECRDDSVRDAAVSAVYGACKNDARAGRSGGLVLKELKASTATTEKESWIRVLALLGYAEALPAITATLEDADQKLAQSTVSSLGRWPDPAPIDALFDVVEGDYPSNLRRQALAVTLQLATAAADRSMATDEQLIAWFRRASEAIRSVQEKRLLISGLGRVKHIESVRLSASYLGDADVKTEAAYAIVNAAEPLAKGPDYKAVQEILKKMSGVQDQRLLDKIANLQREIEATAARGNH
jgi:HEAT repeat protein